MKKLNKNELVILEFIAKNLKVKLSNILENTGILKAKDIDCHYVTKR